MQSNLITSAGDEYIQPVTLRAAGPLRKIERHRNEEIPFIGGTSRTKSHNLFITLQQAISIFRKNQWELKLLTEHEKPEDEKRTQSLDQRLLIAIEKASAGNLEQVSRQFKIVFKNLLHEFKQASREYDEVLKELTEVDYAGTNQERVYAELNLWDKKLLRKEDTIASMIEIYSQLLKSSEKSKRLEIAKLSQQGNVRLRTSSSTNILLRKLLREVQKYQTLSKS